jgi:hypothetical protein
MFRKDLIDLLLNHPMSVHDIARQLLMTPKDVENDLQHLLKTLRHGGYRAHVEPARCRKCGFVFHQDKLHKPGKCPQCHGTWITDPRIGITTE